MECEFSPVEWKLGSIEDIEAEESSRWRWTASSCYFVRCFFCCGWGWGDDRLMWALAERTKGMMERFLWIVGVFIGISLERLGRSVLVGTGFSVKRFRWIVSVVVISTRRRWCTLALFVWWSCLVCRLEDRDEECWSREGMIGFCLLLSALRIISVLLFQTFLLVRLIVGKRYAVSWPNVQAL